METPVILNGNPVFPGLGTGAVTQTVSFRLIKKRIPIDTNCGGGLYFKVPPGWRGTSKENHLNPALFSAMKIGRSSKMKLAVTILFISLAASSAFAQAPTLRIVAGSESSR